MTGIKAKNYLIAHEIRYMDKENGKRVSPDHIKTPYPINGVAALAEENCNVTF